MGQRGVVIGCVVIGHVVIVVVRASSPSLRDGEAAGSEQEEHQRQRGPRWGLTEPADWHGGASKRAPSIKRPGGGTTTPARGTLPALGSHWHPLRPRTRATVGPLPLHRLATVGPWQSLPDRPWAGRPMIADRH